MNRTSTAELADWRAWILDQCAETTVLDCGLPVGASSSDTLEITP